MPIRDKQTNILHDEEKPMVAKSLHAGAIDPCKTLKSSPLCKIVGPYAEGKLKINSYRCNEWKTAFNFNGFQSIFIHSLPSYE